MSKLNLRPSEAIRNTLTKEESNRIHSMYVQLAKDTANQIDKMDSVGVEGAAWQKRKYLQNLGEKILDGSKTIHASVEKEVYNKAMLTVQAVISDNNNFLHEIGIETERAFFKVPADVVQSVLSGQLYGKLPNGSDWTVSKAIWSDVSKHQSDIEKIIAEGIASNRSAYDIAKDLEKYVDPRAKKSWDWGKVYPGTTKRIDYCAQRLSRTMIAHAYQQALVETTKKNPFVSGYIWHSGHSDRTCEICNDRDGQFYSKNELPLDHPNGLCYWTCDIPASMDEIAERLADWANGKSDPSLDGFMEYLKAG